MFAYLLFTILTYFNRYEIEHINNPRCKEFQKDFESSGGSKTKIFTTKEYPQISDNFYQECDVYDEIILGEGITQVYPYMFYSSTIKKVTLNENITSIGEGSFAHCKQLTIFTFNSSIQTIGDGAFYQSSLGNSTQFPVQISSESLCSIGVSAFEGCPLKGSLVNLTCKNLQGSCIIKERAFYGTQIKSIKLNRIQKIEEYAFLNCHFLKNIYEDALSCDRICRYAFYNCSKFDSTVLINSTFIGDCAFLLTKLTVKLRLYNNNNNYDIQIGSYAFAGLTISCSLYFNQNARVVIYDYAFYKCIFRCSFDSTHYLNFANVVVYPYSFAHCNFMSQFVLMLNQVELKSRCFE